MKLVESSVEEWEQQSGLDGVYRAIERAARICYASENKSGISSKEFVEGLIKKDHARCLEFGSVYLFMPRYNSLTNLALGLFKADAWTKIESEKDGFYVSTNLRSVLKNDITKEAFEEYLTEPSDKHHIRRTFHFVCSRGVGDEFRTHISLSSMMQSTRYCNYSSGKFGGNVSYIIPEWYKTADRNTQLLYKNKLCYNEKDYMEMLDMGLKPQEARGILGIDVKTELVMCGFDDAWRNFIYRRDSYAAHPDAQKLAKEIHSFFE